MTATGASPSPAISVVITARNAAATLGATLDALGEQDLELPYEVVVVDDVSSDDTAAIAEAAATPVKLVRRLRGEGAGAARNEGVEASLGPALAFTDSDCVPGPAWLREGLAALAEAELVQGAVRPEAGVERRPFDRTLWVGSEYGLYETANLFVTRSAFERVGGFEDWRSTGSGRPFGEDAWLGWRIRRSGASTAFAERALVEHTVFRGSPPEFVRERLRLSNFPPLVARVPELRTTFLHRRWFLNERTRQLDVALGGVTTAVALARGGHRGLGALAVTAAIPYARAAYSSARAWGRRDAPRVLAVECAADLVGLAALVVGSIRARTFVL